MKEGGPISYEATPSAVSPLTSTNPLDRGEIGRGESRPLASLFPRDAFLDRLDDFMVKNTPPFEYMYG